MLRILALTFLIALAPPAAQAEPSLVRDRIVEVLTDDGYEEIRISRTLLGRMRFIATKPRHRREIVVNPVTGVILRDYIRVITANASSGTSGASGGSGGPSYDDDEDDDDYDDDDRDDDDDDDDRDDEDRSGSNSGSDDDDDRSGSNSGSDSDRDDDD